MMRKVTKISILTPPGIINKAKTVKTADLLPEKSKQLYRMGNAMICLCNGVRKTKLEIKM
jgi:hypothetical protein